MLFTCVRTILGILLAVTAVLKLHLLLTDPFADIKTGSSLPILWLAVFIEVAIVYVAFSKVSKELKWGSLVVIFVILSGVSLYNVTTGKSDCGCSGAIAIHPVWFLAIDVLAVVALFACRPEINPAKVPEEISRIDSNKTMGRIAAITLIAMLFIGLQTTFARDVLGSVLWKHDISTIPVYLGELTAEPIECELVLKNHSSTSRKIIGINSSCSCVVPQDIVHSSIPSHGQLAVKVKVMPKSVSAFHQRILFYLDSSRQYVVAADLFGSFKGN
jgi:hypothetical protein